MSPTKALPRTVPPTPVLAKTRGRTTARRKQNREAVIDALLSLFRDGTYQPSMAEIATRAGLSLRSVFRYFDDVDDLHRAAAIRQVALVLPLLEVPVPAAPLAAKSPRWSRRGRRCTSRSARPPGRCGRARTGTLRWPRTGPQPRVPAQPAGRHFRSGPGRAAARARRLCSFESWEVLRHDQGLSGAATERASPTPSRALLGLHQEVWHECSPPSIFTSTRCARGRTRPRCGCGTSGTS